MSDHNKKRNPADCAAEPATRRTATFDTPSDNYGAEPDGMSALPGADEAARPIDAQTQANSSLVDPRPLELTKGLRRPTLKDLGDLPAVIDLVTAAKILGIGRTKAYELAQADNFPCRVLRIGGSYRVPTSELLRTIGWSSDL
jgi:helix-turn-helix protein